jgi:hypothetical protein
LALAIALFRSANGRRPVTLWAWAFVFITIASLAGAYYHACRMPLSLQQTSIAWKVVPVSTGVAMFFFGWAAATAWLRSRLRRRVVGLLAVQIGGCLVWALYRNGFAVTVAESVPVLLALLTGSALRRRDRASRWIAAGVLTTFLAAIVQVSHLFGLETVGGVDFNVIFHVIELAANYLLFRAGLLLEE